MTQGMEWSLIMWSVVTGILLILVFYRSTLTRQEDDQLFIDESSSSRAMEQRQLIAKVNRINPLVKLVGATSGLMILAIAGWAVYNGLNSVQP
jgi:choline-glycine betaine transporter